jgi:MOSC domain-containing protein YiiM
VKKTFRILSVNLSSEKGTVKKPADETKIIVGHGMENDAHAGDWHRQVSLLAMEDIDTMRVKLPEISPGDFAENITTEGVDLPSLPIGTILSIGDVKLEVTQIGKDCHAGCEILAKTGECVMPKRGIFARVIEGGVISSESAGSYNL